MNDLNRNALSSILTLLTTTQIPPSLMVKVIDGSSIVDNEMREFNNQWRQKVFSQGSTYDSAIDFIRQKLEE